MNDVVNRCDPLPERVADGLVPLGGDGDDHVDGAGLHEALVRVDEVRERHAVPQRLRQTALKTEGDDGERIRYIGRGTQSH